MSGGKPRPRRPQGRKTAGPSEPASAATAVSRYRCSGCRRLSSRHGNCWAPRLTPSRAPEVGCHALEPSKRKAGSKGHTCGRSAAPRTDNLSKVGVSFMFLYNEVVLAWHCSLVCLAPRARRLQILSLVTAPERGWVGNVATRNARSWLIHSCSYIFQHLPRTCLCGALCQALGLQGNKTPPLSKSQQ